jgi:hypothetical protein
MRTNYTLKNISLGVFVLLVFAVASCKKDKKNNNIVTPPPVTATPKQVGLYEADSSIYKEIEIAVSQVGTKSLDIGLVYDTGSGGMVLDATGIVPASVIGSSGFTFTGDSTVVNGITITKVTDTVEYGDDAATTDKVYGNLAYASVTIGDEATGNLVIKRLPFFLYYKAVDGQGNKFDPHEFDVMGISPEYDITFSNGVFITSPFSYYSPGTGLTSGFKMAALTTNNFSLEGTYVPNVITLGLTSDDLASGSGFTFSSLTYINGNGYVPLVPATITYGGKSTTAEVIYDTGTEPYNYIQDRNAASTISLLPTSTPVSVVATSGFKYDFTTSASDYLTYVENPAQSKTNITVMSLEFFLNNEYLIDFTGHKLGLKNN